MLSIACSIRNTKITLGAAMVVLACGLACSGGPDDDASNGAPPVEVPDEPTYHEHVGPLMDQYCTGCHVEGAIAPFALDNYADVIDQAGISHASMLAGQMPPWPPAADCGEFKGERRMHPAEIEIFERWRDQGKVEGDPEDRPPGDDGDELDEEPDFIVDTGVEYHPQPPPGNQDDYRCFLVDPDLDGDRFVSSVDTRPGNPEIVHHLIAYTAPEEAWDEIAELEAEDDRPGYECFGSPRYSGAQMVAGWVPGAQRTPLEDGHGVRIPDGSKLVVQMHYTTKNDPEGTDRTEVDFFLVDQDEHPEPVELLIMRLADFDLRLEAGDADATASDETPLIPKSITVHGVAPHMHLLGTRVRVEATTGDGDVCLVDVPDWDFHWQGLYLYEEPVVLSRPFRVELTCEYDNSARNQPDGQEPRDVYWGDESRDEMCLALLVVEVPEGLEL